MAARLPETGSADVRGVDELVASSAVSRLPVLLELSPHAGAIRVPEHETGPDTLGHREEIALAA